MSFIKKDDFSVKMFIFKSPSVVQPIGRTENALDGHAASILALIEFTLYGFIKDLTEVFIQNSSQRSV